VSMPEFDSTWICCRWSALAEAGDGFNLVDGKLVGAKAEADGLGNFFFGVGDDGEEALALGAFIF
jgi:hypothetical protein